MASIRITDDRAEYERENAAGKHITYAAAVNLPLTVAPVCKELRSLVAQTDKANILNPVHLFTTLRHVRAAFEAKKPAFEQQLADCLKRLAEPVEGTADDHAHTQGFTTAKGLSAFFELHACISEVREVLDRKAAYALASLSLYVAVVSLLATTVFGYLSIK